MKGGQSVAAPVKRAVNQRWRCVLILAVGLIVVVLISPPASGFKILETLGVTNPRTDPTTAETVGIIPACQSGQLVELRANVLQESSGALAEGEWLGSCTPDFQNYKVESKTVAGSPELQDGLASVFLFGVTRSGSEITSVGEGSGRTFIIRSAPQGKTPNLTVTNTTDPSRNPGFKLGDSWRLDLTLASPNAPVFLAVEKDHVDLGVIGPLNGLTDAQGRWSLSGSFGASSDVAFWAAQAVIGNSDSSERSTAVLVIVE